MWLKLLVGFAFVSSLAGCATARRNMSADQQTSRISELEQQLDQKDEEINELRSELEGVSSEATSKDFSSKKTRRSSDAIAVTYKKDGIIRVDASPDQVQLALKKAGFYDGPIDGKVGGKTRKAIADFQKSRNLNPDGIVGRKTWSELQVSVQEK